MSPLAIADLEELCQHRPVQFPGAFAQPGYLRQHPIFVPQAAAAPQMEQQHQIRAMLFGTKVHGIGEVVAYEDRHPDVGLHHAQSLRMVVLCPKRLIDSFHLAT